MKRIALTLALGCVACGSQPNGSGTGAATQSDTTMSKPAANAPERVLKAARVADAIAADPDRMDAILAENDMTKESFEALMYEISADAELTAAYNAARKN